MKFKISIIAAAVATTAALAAVPSASASGFTRCDGDDHFEQGAGWYALKTKGNISCDVANQIADAYTFGQDSTPKGFDCEETQIGDELWKVKCVKDTISHGRQKVKFVYGA